MRTLTTRRGDLHGISPKPVAIAQRSPFARQTLLLQDQTLLLRYWTSVLEHLIAARKATALGNNPNSKNYPTSLIDIQRAEFLVTEMISEGIARAHDLESMQRL